MYDLFFEKPEALVERYLRFELTERISASGEVLTPLSESELWQLKEELEKEAVESVAVCTLHAYAFPQHENVVGDFLRAQLPDVPVSLSSEVLPERKELRTHRYDCGQCLCPARHAALLERYAQRFTGYGD